jgi:hypothetical protein
MLSKSALICTVLVTSLPLPIRAHDIYSQLKDERGKSCCNSMDCHPAPYQVTPRGVKMFVDERWIDVPNDKIQYLSLPGDDSESGGGHWCGQGYEPGGADPNVPYVTKCAILPPQVQ